MYCVFSTNDDFSAFKINRETSTNSSKIALEPVGSWFRAQALGQLSKFKYVCEENNAGENDSRFSPFQVCTRNDRLCVLNLISQEIIGPVLDVEFDLVAYEAPYLIVAARDMLLVHRVSGDMLEIKAKNIGKIKRKTNKRAEKPK